jgi:hypothetical protein
MQQRRERENRDEAERKADRSPWTIETESRIQMQQKSVQNKVKDMKDMLDQQIKANRQERELKRDYSKDMGKKLVEEDLKKYVEQKELETFKKYELAKSLRENWTKQQMFKNSQK